MVIHRIPKECSSVSGVMSGVELLLLLQLVSHDLILMKVTQTRFLARGEWWEFPSGVTKDNRKY